MTIQMHTAMNQVQLLNGDSRAGHMTLSCMTSSQVTKTFSSITPHRIEVETWARCHCVCLVKTHRSICNMTYLGHLSGQVISPDQGHIFKLTFRGQDAYVSMRLDERNTMVFRVFSIFLSLKVIRKKLYLPKKATLFCLICPGKVKM